MALDILTLGKALLDSVDAEVGTLTQEEMQDSKRRRQVVFTALAIAIVEHIKNFAEVTVTVNSVSGVTTGAGVSGAGTGTGKIT